MPQPGQVIFAVALLVVFLVTPFASGDATFSLPNPSFKEDSELDGVPDGWNVPASAQVERASHASHGSRAAKFTDGYVLLTLDQQVERLAGQTVVLTLDAAGEEGAMLGAQFAYQHRQPDGSAKLVHHRLTWDRPLTREYKSLTFPLRFAEDAVDGRVWLGFYRSNKQGTVYLDNLAVTARGSVSEQEAAELARIYREWSYLVTAAEGAADHLSERAEVDEVLMAARDISRRALEQDVALLADAGALQQRWGEARARLHRALAHGRPLIVGWSHGIERLTPEAVVPVTPPMDWHAVALEGAYGALGATVWNAQAEEVVLAVRLDGLEAAADDITIRRQVFLENWYDKEKSRTADALPQLERKGDAWRLPLAPGEVVRLYVGFRTRPEASGTHAIGLTLGGEGTEVPPQRLSATLEVLPAQLPTAPRLEHWQCIYPTLSPAAQHPELTAKDMAAHYVTSAQFPWAPDAEFDAQGHLLTHDFASTKQARWMRAYAPHIDKLWIFWEGSMNGGLFLKDENGEKLEPIADDGQWRPEIRIAFAELLRAWLDFAEAEGFGLDHWAILPDDEPHSGDEWATDPSPAIRRTLDLYSIVRSVEPDLEVQVTLGNYALDQDARALIPHVDVALPILPYPEKLVRWSPPNYNPREAYEATTAPLLREAQKAGNLKVWSYRVSRGIKDDVLSEVLSYPVQAVAKGYTGIGYWAYNVTRGKSWEDRDGGLLDYTFIYNGLEKHPLNERYNVTKEVIVPSIRWEALRIGHQHGQVLLTLRDRLDTGAVPAELRGDVEALLAEAGQFTTVPGSHELTHYLAFAERLLRTYAAVDSATQVPHPAQ